MRYCFLVSFFKILLFFSFSRFLRHQCDVQLRRRAQQIREELVRDSFILYRCCVVKKLVHGLCLPLIPTDQEAPSSLFTGLEHKVHREAADLAEHALDTVTSS